MKGTFGIYEYIYLLFIFGFFHQLKNKFTHQSLSNLSAHSFSFLYLCFTAKCHCKLKCAHVKKNILEGTVHVNSPVS